MLFKLKIIKNVSHLWFAEQFCWNIFPEIQQMLPFNEISDAYNAKGALNIANFYFPFFTDRKQIIFVLGIWKKKFSTST